MQSTIVHHRHSSYIFQSGFCYYCGAPMWESSINSFANMHGIPAEKADLLKCTAEHLVARQDGGNNSKKNIVAACLRCNQTRHRMRPAPDSLKYRTIVQKQVKKGTWHKKEVMKLMDR